MSNSSLVNYTKISPNSTNPRQNTIKKITIHHVAGNASVETLGNIFAPESRNASANYGIGSDGRVGMYVEEKNRAWTSGNADNDNQAITIEVANDGGAPDWHVSDKAFAKLIDLCVDICKRNNMKELTWTGDKNGTLTCHYMFQATACPGAYLKSKMPYIAQEVTKRLQPKYVGHLDTATSTLATGWAWNSIDDTVLKVELKVYKNGQLIRTFSTNANVYREDLKKVGVGNGKHGFNFKLNLNGLGYGTFTLKAFANGIQLSNTKTVVIEAPKATVTPKPTITVTSQNSVVAGQKLSLNKVKLYSSSNAGKESGTVTGTYYIWSKDIINGRIRITNAANRVGISGQITGFVNVSDIGVKTTTTTISNVPKEGDRIKLKSGTTYFDGTAIPMWLKLLPLYHRGVNKYHKDCIDFSWKKTGDISGTIKADMVTKA